MAAMRLPFVVNFYYPLFRDASAAPVPVLLPYGGVQSAPSTPQQSSSQPVWAAMKTHTIATR